MKRIIILLILTSTLTACASHSRAALKGIDEESGFSAEEIQSCQVIIESNQSECDDGDIQNGDIDATI